MLIATKINLSGLKKMINPDLSVDFYCPSSLLMALSAGPASSISSQEVTTAEIKAMKVKYL